MSRAGKNKKSDKRTPTVKERTKKRFSFLSKVPPYALLFALLWFFAAFVYNDVFYIAEQNTYFAFDSVLMKNVTDMSDSCLILVGRFFLLLFHYPLLGGFVWSAILTTCVYLINYIFHLKGYSCIIAFSVPFLFAAFLVYRGLNLFYQNDPHYIFSYPLLLLAVLAIVAVVVRIVAHRHFMPMWKNVQDIPFARHVLSLLAQTVFFIALLVYAIPFHVNERTATKMQRLMEKGDWDGMIEAALKVDRPSRSVCCYYAIALSQTGQIASRLFDLHYQYPNMHLVNRAGNPDSGTEYFVSDCDFYAGLVNTSYHGCMERNVIDGINAARLKRMFFCAMLNNELELAYKHLSIISIMPFENAFVEKYGDWVRYPEKMKQDADLMKVAELMPAEDSFEQHYRTPLFIGYNVALTVGRSARALENSLAACLYAKELDAFYFHAQLLRGSVLPKSFEECMALIGIKDKEKLQSFQVSPIAINTLKVFLGDALEYKGEKRTKVFYDLNPKYKGYYPFYYYFQNIPDNNYVFDKKEKGSVN